MKIEIEYNSKVNDASRKYILDSILLPYLNWQQYKTLQNFTKIPTHSFGGRHIHKHLKCIWNITSGLYKKLLREYVKKVTFDFEEESEQE